MNRFFRTTVVSACLAATTLTAIPAANARDRWDRRHHEVTRQSDDSDVIVAGLLGLAVGAIIVGAISQPEPRGLIDRDPNDGIDPYESLGYFPPAPQAAAVMDDIDYTDEEYFREPTPPTTWDVNDRGWYKYCEDSYRWGKSRGVKKFSCSVDQ